MARNGSSPDRGAIDPIDLRAETMLPKERDGLGGGRQRDVGGSNKKVGGGEPGLLGVHALLRLRDGGPIRELHGQVCSLAWRSGAHARRRTPGENPTWGKGRKGFGQVRRAPRQSSPKTPADPPPPSAPSASEGCPESCFGHPASSPHLRQERQPRGISRLSPEEARFAPGRRRPR